MRTLGTLVLVSLAAVLGSSRAAGPAPAEDADAVRRGEYLALHVAQCVQCHTPRDETGSLDRTRLFRGAAVPVEGPDFVERWATHAPSLAGPSEREAEILLSVLTRGHRPDGEVPRPPMPPFRMERADAQAIVAYLRSLD